MNLAKLFETQKLLDKRIVDEHNLHGQDLLPKKILSLQVELAELAQEWRGFKFWSRDQEPRTKEVLGWVNPQKYKNPLLEEFSDCLHFILSIGNDLEVDINKCRIENYKNDTVIEQFKDMFNMVCDLHDDKTDIQWSIVIGFYLGLGEMLGFTWEQIEQAYYQKNKINHQRQTDKY